MMSCCRTGPLASPTSPCKHIQNLQVRVNIEQHLHPIQVDNPACPAYNKMLGIGAKTHCVWMYTLSHTVMSSVLLVYTAWFLISLARLPTISPLTLYK